MLKDDFEKEGGVNQIAPAERYHKNIQKNEERLDSPISYKFMIEVTNFKKFIHFILK